jgi:putative component of membrane protein insertase Oxa1/YidC/SpoIIIJ protein YidD
VLKQLYFLLGLVFLTGVSYCQSATEQYGTGNSTLLGFYQQTLSTARGVSCAMHPSCSQYAKLAFQNYGAVKALALTTDRLMRCGHDLGEYPKTVIDNSLLNYDPLHDTAQQQVYYQTYRSTIVPDSSLVNFLINKRQFLEARVELWREIHLASGGSAHLFFLVGKTYFLEEDYAGLQRFYRNHFTSFLSSSYQDSIKILVGKSYLEEGKAEAARAVLSSLRESTANSPEALFVSALVDLHAQQYRDCEQRMKSIPNSNRFYTLAQAFEHLSEEAEIVRQKNPVKSAILSGLLPGSGYLVAGKPSTALTSLVINTLFAAIGIEAFNNRHYALGSSALLLGSGWYIGAIIGSYNATIKWNRKQHQTFIKQKTLNLNLHQP